MESIPFNPLVEYNSDTLEFVRNLYELGKPERLEDAIKILRDWLEKQDHIIRKNYSNNYLERVIITNKGSVERAKAKLDKIATYRTLLPQFFEPLNNMTDVSTLNEIFIATLPKMTEDHYRIYLTKPKVDTYSRMTDFFKYLIMICEYAQAHDYCNGIVTVFDYTTTNIFEMIKAINVVEMQQTLQIAMGGYGMRLKGLHFITTSKAIDVFLQLLKTALSKKVADRIQVHKNMDSLFEYIPKELFPSDYGGQAKTLYEHHCDLKAEIVSEHFTAYFREMQNACTNENYRRDDKFNDQCIGMPGSFRKLSVD